MSNTALTCGKCDEGWICERHPNLPWPHDQCPGRAMPCDVADCAHRIEPRPVSKKTGLGCLRCRQPVATIEAKTRARSSSNAPGAATAGQPIMRRQGCVRGTHPLTTIHHPACGDRWNAEERPRHRSRFEMRRAVVDCLS